MSAVVAEIVRNGFVEGRHHGSFVALSPSGEVLEERGDARATMLPRSCNKPIQALAMVRAGLDLDGELLALACASHSGEPFHVDGVRRILAGVSLTEAALACPPDWPLDEQAKVEVVRAGGEKAPILMNCSGKHAAMLATCVINGWPTEGYLAPDHPLQQAIRETFAEVTGEPVGHDAVDGCGAPLLGTSLVGLASAFARIVRGETEAEARIAAAISGHPEFVSGTRRDECALLRAMPGAIGKFGAEAVEVVALADGTSYAVKIEDGGDRARPVVMAALIERTGGLDRPGVDAEAVRATGRAPLLGGPELVGEIRAC